MKKSRKVWLITALVLFIGSIVCFCVSACFEDNPKNLLKKIIQIGEKSDEWNRNEPLDADEYVLLEQFDAANLKEIDLELEVGEIIVRPVSAESCRILIHEDDDRDNISVEQHDKEVKVKEKSHKALSMFNFSIFRECYTLVVELPEKEYSLLDCDVEVGQIILGDISANTIKADVEVGSIEVSLPGTAEQYSIDADIAIGDVNLPHEERFQTQEGASKVSLDCEIGSIDVEWSAEWEENDSSV